MNTEAQNILHWIREQGVTDTKLSDATGIARETLCRIRKGNNSNKVSGNTILPTLRRIQIKGKTYAEAMLPVPYQPVSPPRVQRTVPKSMPIPQPPKHQTHHATQSPMRKAVPKSMPIQQTPSRPSQKQTATPKLPAYRIGQNFTCKCGYANRARAVQSYCVRCEKPYTVS